MLYAEDAFCSVIFSQLSDNDNYCGGTVIWSRHYKHSFAVSWLHAQWLQPIWRFCWTLHQKSLCNCGEALFIKWWSVFVLAKSLHAWISKIINFKTNWLGHYFLTPPSRLLIKELFSSILSQRGPNCWWKGKYLCPLDKSLSGAKMPLILTFESHFSVG